MLAVLASLSGSTRAGAGQPGRGDGAARTLAGTIDIHVHSAPDNTPRSVDAIEAATLARARGMRAIVLKNHYDPTGGLAYLVRTQVPGIEVFGGVDLNLTIGRHEPGGRRTHDEGIRRMGTPRVDVHLRRREPGSLLEREPAVRQHVAQRRAAARGQAGDRGDREARPGARHRTRFARRSADAAARGPAAGRSAHGRHARDEPAGVDGHSAHAGSGETRARSSSSWRALSTTADAAARVDRYAAAIRAIGPEFCVLSSDLGQKANALPPDGFAAFLSALEARGLTTQDVDRMSKQNPARLLGLP